MVPWNCCFLTESIDDAWTNFKDLLFIAADQSIPMICLRQNKKQLSWLSDESLKLIKCKRRAFKKAKRTHKEEDTRKYKSISNTVRALTSLKRDHKNHLDDITNNLKTSPKRSGASENLTPQYHTWTTRDRLINHPPRKVKL